MRQTSLLAWNEIRANKLYLTQSYKEILRCLEKCGAFSDYEIAKYLGYHDPNKVRPRRNELMRAKIIIKKGVRTCSVSQKTVTVWKINPLYALKNEK